MAARRRVEAMAGAGPSDRRFVRLTISQLARHDMRTTRSVQRLMVPSGDRPPSQALHALIPDPTAATEERPRWVDSGPSPDWLKREGCDGSVGMARNWAWFGANGVIDFWFSVGSTHNQHRGR